MVNVIYIAIKNEDEFVYIANKLGCPISTKQMDRITTGII